MRRYFVALTTFALLLGFSNLAIAGSPKPSTKCKVVGQTTNVSGNKFICMKSGKSLAWTIAPKQSNGSTPPATQTGDSQTSQQTMLNQSPCSIDANADPEWKDLIKYFADNNHCLGPTRLIPAVLGSARPSISNSDSSLLLPISACKLTAPDGVEFRRAWLSNYQLNRWMPDLNHPNPHTVIQVIPFYTADSAQPTSTPQADYQKYFTFLKTLIDYDADNGSTFQIKVPDHYYKLPKTLAEYGVKHAGGTDDQNIRRQIFSKDLISASDADIDFSSANIVLSIAPPGTSIDLSEAGALWPTSADGKSLNMMNATPYTLMPNMTGNAASVSPMWWYHELFHPGAQLVDHNGNNYWQNHFGTDPSQPGMGNWGLMSMALTDLLTLEKWVLGYISDDQVKCVNKSATTTQWIVPSSVKASQVKLVMIPLSNTEAILVESQRAAGINFMLGKQSEGVLVYHLNTAETDRESGLEVLTRSGYQMGSSPFIYGDAPLKSGESLTYKGVKVSVRESGSYGDVVTVSPAS